VSRPERIRVRPGGCVCARSKGCLRFERENGLARSRAQLCGAFTVQSSGIEKRESVAPVVNSEGFGSHPFNSPEIAERNSFDSVQE
jgi:hypothetical protein